AGPLKSAQPQETAGRPEAKSVGVGTHDFAWSRGTGHRVREAELGGLPVDLDYAPRPREKPVDPRRQRVRRGTEIDRAIVSYEPAAISRDAFVLLCKRQRALAQLWQRSGEQRNACGGELRLDVERRVKWHNGHALDVGDRAGVETADDPHQ